MTATATAPVTPTTPDVVVVPVARFQDMLARVEPAVARSSWLTALLSIRLFTDPDSTLRAQGTDATWGVDASIEASVQGGFDVLVPARKLRLLVDTFLPGSTVTLELRGSEMVVKSDRSVTRFHTASADEYPTFPQATGTLLDCQGERLKLAADLTTWAAARDDSRPALKNVQVTINEGKVKFAAADGYAVAVWDGFTDTDESEKAVHNQGPVEFLVPASALRQMGRVAGQQGKNWVTLSVSGEDGSSPNHVILEASTPEMTLRVTSRCMEGPFPDVQRVIDQSLTRGRDLPTFSQAVFLPDHALTALRRVLLMAADTKNPDGSQPVTGQGIQTTIGDGAVRLEATTQEGEEAHDTFDADTVGHGQVKFGSDLLDKMLVAIKAGDPIGAVTVNAPSPLAPSTFHPEGIPGFVGLLTTMDPGKAAEA